MRDNEVLGYYSPEDTYPIPFPQTDKETRDEQIRMFIRNYLPQIIEKRKQKKLKNEAEKNKE
jgi:hypothetical protein|nr:hypothetical protein [uncultured Campylobacter sp.]